MAISLSFIAKHLSRESLGGLHVFNYIYLRCLEFPGTSPTTNTNTKPGTTRGAHIKSDFHNTLVNTAPGCQANVFIVYHPLPPPASLPSHESHPSPSPMLIKDARPTHEPKENPWQNKDTLLNFTLIFRFFYGLSKMLRPNIKRNVY